MCVTVTLLDGLVLARSTFHHSMNYRSCVVLGTAEPITDLEEKRAALEAIVEHIVPGRSAEVRTHACRFHTRRLCTRMQFLHCSLFWQWRITLCPAGAPRCVRVQTYLAC